MGSLILTVDRNKRNLELLTQFLTKQGYESLAVSSVEDFDEALKQVENFRLALVDIAGFDRQIWQYCERLAENGIPLLILSPPHVSSIHQESLSHGAQGVLFKPLVLKEFTSMLHQMFQD